jgi:dTDP-4-amino-4,6-dideoxygalactose transaminase
MWNSLLDADNEHRKAIAKRYLNEIKMKNHLTNGINWWKEAIQSRFHLFVIRTQIDLQDYLHQNGIRLSIIQFRLTIKRLCHFLNHLSFPITQKIHDEVLSLPINLF